MNSNREELLLAEVSALSERHQVQSPDVLEVTAVEGGEIIEARLKRDHGNRVHARAQPLCGPIEPRMQHILVRSCRSLAGMCAENDRDSSRLSGEGVQSQVLIGLRLNPTHRHGDAPLIAHTRSAG